jgi:hypothetical protein
MLALVSLFVVLTLSVIIVRIAASALILTGLSRQSAQFQARSAFTGVGFTTTESESIVNHPVRRRIVMGLMMLGNLGISGVMASLIVAFVNVRDVSEVGQLLFVLIGGLLGLWVVGSTTWFQRRLSRVISYALRKWTDLDVRDYASLLRLGGDYTIGEQRVDPSHWMANKTLEELALRNEGILVLGIVRSDGSYVGTPEGTTAVLPKDTLLIYGRAQLIEELGRREDHRPPA